MPFKEIFFEPTLKCDSIKEKVISYSSCLFRIRRSQLGLTTSKISRLTALVGLFLLSLFLNHSSAQSNLSGNVQEWRGKAGGTTLPGANVYWLLSNDAVITDQEGNFNIQMPQTLPAQLIISFVGFQSDTLLIENSSFVRVKLKSSIDLEGVDITARREAIGISTLKTINVEKITQKELLKAACCNLSEAFETSPTVNVAYKDAVTGAKEIQMLGLAGVYSQLMTENIPAMRGISGIYGLTFIPGPWMESIQVTKGSGSVANGYESTTGQINIELLKPQSDETPRFYLNLFREVNGNSEINTHYRKKLNDKWSSILMLHGNFMGSEMDHNDDGFKDVPTGHQLNLYNRWQYDSGDRMESQIGLKLLADRREGGQVENSPGTGPSGEIYSTAVDNLRAEGFVKVGIVYPKKPFKSIGNIVDFSIHDLSSSFGLKTFDATQKSVYLQSIYQNTFAKTNHQYKIGIGYRYDITEQKYNLFSSTLVENVPGVFVEYTYNYIDKLTIISGVREDYHNNHGWIFTPRLHAKYNFTDNLILRGSAGRSFRVPSVYADNISVMASSKTLRITESIMPERAWNYGINSTFKFSIVGREASFSADFYRTDFIDQLIVDPYSDSSAILFYNLKGESYSNSVQFSFNYELLPRLDIRLAYKMDDVRSTYQGLLEDKPLVSKNKALANLAFATPNEHWKFDYTFIWDGQKKLPATWDHAEHGSQNNYSPDFVVMHAQVTKVFRKFEVYAGAENLLDYTQHQPVINPDNPFSNEFDASRIWGPIDGRRVFAGLRYKIR
jgi:hypothetical protein